MQRDTTESIAEKEADRPRLDRSFLVRLRALRRWLLDPTDAGKRAEHDAAFLGFFD